jgi:two-component system, NtrC family, sensor histidine kinase PilS
MPGRSGDDDTALRRRLLWLIGLRAVSLAVLLGAAVLLRARGVLAAVTADPLFVLIAVTFALTGIYAATLRYVPRHRWLVDVQLAADSCIASAIVLATGGITSLFATFYVVPVVAGAVVARRRGGMLVASLGATLYAGIVLAQYLGPLGPAGLDLPAGRQAAAIVLLNGAGFVVVGLLAGYLAESLESAGARLERASTQIADLRAFNQHVIDSLTGGLATTTPGGRILTFNRAAEAITGVPAHGAVNQPVWDVLQLSEDARGSLEGFVATGRARRLESAFVKPSGGRIALGLSIAPLVTSTGQSGFIVSFQDVTEAKRREAEAQLQKRLAAVGEMAAGIAHEIRNPLASMTGSIQLLRQELALTAQQAQLMDIVLRESRRLNETIAELLSYARPARREATRVDLRRLLEDTALLIRNGTECGPAHEVRVVSEEGALFVTADEAQVRQIVWNLATNGLRAMPRGGRLALSTERADLPEGGVVLRVRDEGVGIAPDDLDHVFHPFRSSFSRGAGLGLAIVHRIVSDHGGEVRVSSIEGEGTEVTVTLPGEVDAVAGAPLVLSDAEPTMSSQLDAAPERLSA